MSTIPLGEYLVTRHGEVVERVKAEDPTAALTEALMEGSTLTEKTGHKVYKLATGNDGEAMEWGQEELEERIKDHHLGE